MKKTLIAIAALAAALVGCQQYGDDQIVTNEPLLSGKTFYGYIESESRVVLDENNKTNWETGDFITVFPEANVNVKYKVELEEGKTQDTWAKFVEHSAPDYNEDELVFFDKFYAATPYNDNNTISKDSEGNDIISVVMAGNFDNVKANDFDCYPYVAYSNADEDTFAFQQVASLLRIRVYKSTFTPAYLNSLTVSSAKNQNIAGNALINMSAAQPIAVIADDADAMKSVTLNFGEGHEGLALKKGKDKGEYVYVALPQMVFEENDLTIDFVYTFGNEENCTGSIVKEPSISFVLGKAKTTNIEITGKTFEGGVSGNPVASVNGVLKNTLEEAFTEAIGLGGAQTISMLSPAVVENAITIPNGSDITLILNGNEVTSAIEGVLFTNNGKMTITDGTITAEKDLFRMENGSALTVGAGATLVSNTDAVIYAPAGAKDITINIIGAVETKTTDYAAIQTNATTEYPTGNQVNIVEGAVVKSENTVALYCPGSEINIAGGEITGYTAIYHKKGVLNIAGGTLTATGADKAYQFYGNGCVETGDALVIEACEESSSYAPCVLNITGGKFVSTQENTAAIAYYKQSESAKAVEYTVTGGSFSSNPAEFLAHDYRADFNGETNLFDVVSDVVVKIGENEYTTLAEAVADAEEGATLELLGDNEEQEVILIGKDITIDGSKASAMKSAMRLNSNSTATAAYTIKSSATRVIQITEPNVKVTLKNLNIVSTAKRDGTNDVRGINIHTTATEGVELTLENVNVSFEPESGKDWAYAVNVTNTNNHTIYIKGGTYEGANNINIWGNNHTVTVEGATLKNTYGPNDQCCGVGVKLDQGTGKVATLNDVTFSGTNAMLWEEANLDANTITIDGVRQVNGDKQLEAALMNWDVEEVKVNVLYDVNFNVSDAYIKVGGASTKTVEIEGNNNLLTLTTNYWSRLNTQNDATLTLKNMDLTSSQTSGTWNSYDVTFQCNTNLENVNLLKAVALDGENKTFNLKNVNIEESHDYYALWIAANGATVNVDGLNIKSAGRGIKIDDEYCNESTALVELNIKNATFETAKKAAIMTKTTKGAEIVAENLNIENVAADQMHAVWVDEDGAEYYDLVTVTGCLKWVEGDIYVAEGLILSKDEVTYRVYTAEGMAYLATLSNDGEDFSGKTILLMNEIDLGAYNWAPIGSETTNFKGTFDGQKNIIKNLKINVTEAKEGKAYMGLFGYAKNANFKDVDFENVDIFVACLDIDHSQGHIGALAGSLEGTSTIENVTVRGDVKVESTYEANGASRVAVVAGGNSYGDVTMKNVHVLPNTGSYLKANNNVGALAGQLQGKSVFENCSSTIDVYGYKFFAGGIIGLAAGDQTFINCHTTGNISVIAGREGNANDHYRVGGIAGGWSNGATSVCTLDGCSYTGTLLGQNADGTVATYYDYMGYVGRGYGDYAGSKVIIDGKEFVETTKAGDGYMGVYIVDGALEIGTVRSLQWFANEVNGGKNFNKETVRLMADLDLNNEEWEPIGNSTNTFQGTFDGNNYTISNLLITGNRSNVGLFGFTNGYNGTIKNLTVNNAKVSGRLNVAVVAGTPYTTKYENIKVTGHVEVNGMSYVGAVGGKNAYANWKDITVDVDSSSYVNANSIEDGTAYRTYVGGVVGFMGEGGHSFTNVTSNIDVIGTTCDVGGIVGIAHYGNSFINCSSSGDVTITDAEEAGDAEEIGGIAGVWYNENNQTVTFENCSYTGTLKTNITSDVKLDNNTIVGNPYSTGGQGTLVLNGLTRQHIKGGYVWLNQTDGGVYELENRDALYWFANEVNVNKNEFRGKTVRLMTNVALTGTEWTPIGVEAGERYSGLFYGTFDGMGNKITNMVVNQENVAGFFGRLHNATVKNLRIGAATINSNHYAGAICAWAESGASGVTIDNCEVYGSKITSTVANNDNGDKVGGILGYAYKVNINNCRVLESTTITGYRDMGAVAGYAKGSIITNCRVKNAIINVDNTTNYQGYKTQAEYNVGEIYGRCDNVEPTLENNNVTGTVINWGVIPPYLPGGNFGGSVEGEDIDW